MSLGVAPQPLPTPPSEKGGKYFKVEVISLEGVCIPHKIHMYALTKLHTCSIWIRSPILKYSDRQALASSVDLDQMLQNVASNQGLHSFTLIHQF